MMPTYSKDDICLSNPDKTGSQTAKLCPGWFATGKGSNPPRANTEFQPLICSKAFAEIYDAIDKAKYSIDIAIWGFDAWMRFKPSETSETIGELLRRKANDKTNPVISRILVWGTIVTNTLPGQHYNQAYFETDKAYQNKLKYEEYCGVSATKQERQKLNQLIQDRDTSYYHYQRIRNPIPKETDDYHKAIAYYNSEIDKKRNNLSGYGSGGDSATGNSSPYDGAPLKLWMRDVMSGREPNITLHTRTFSIIDRMHIGSIASKDTWIENSPTTLASLKATASHHQKMVIIDYHQNSIQDAVSFVMGHNMHKNYWDTEGHYFYDNDAYRATGFSPWQDISSKVRGSILYDINKNFQSAWERNTNEPLSRYSSASDLALEGGVMLNFAEHKFKN